MTTVPALHVLLRGAKGGHGAERLVIEIDGARYHSTEIARRRGVARDAALHRAGYRVPRLTWHDVVREPDETARRIRRAPA
jgi:very-short-patch-repair endonuclease